MNWWKIGTTLIAAFGEFQTAASDGIITLEEALRILVATLEKLGIRLNYNISQQDAIAALRRLNVIR